MSRLKGKTIVVMGGSAGLGGSAAAAFVREGARVVVVGRNAANLQRTAERLGEDQAAGIVGDARSPKIAETAIQKAVQTFGALDGLYHVAQFTQLLIDILGQVTETTYSPPSLLTMHWVV